VRDELIAIADRIRALATTGLHFTEGPFDRERYEKLLELAAQLAARGTGDEPAAMLRLFRAADEGYVTPKLDVRLALFKADQVLMVRERMDGRWSLPGGFVDVGDSPSDAAVREAVEEAGVVARVARLAGVFDTRLQPDCPPHLFHIHKLVFVGRLVDRATARGSGRPTPVLPRGGSRASLAAPCRSTCEALRAARDRRTAYSTDGRRSPRSRCLRARRLPWQAWAEPRRHDPVSRRRHGEVGSTGPSCATRSSSRCRGARDFVSGSGSTRRRAASRAARRSCPRRSSRWTRRATRSTAR
jgi:ADP-ribose pyrophosphatase YjhB (NUDIX family)